MFLEYKFRPLPLSHQCDFRCFYLFCELQARNSLGERGKHVLDTRASSLIFLKGEQGREGAILTPGRRLPPRRGRRVRPVPSEGWGEGHPEPGESSPRSAPLRALTEALQALRDAFHHRHRASPASDRSSPPSSEASRSSDKKLPTTTEPLQPAPHSAPTLPPAAQHLPPEGKLSALSEPWSGGQRLQRAPETRPSTIIAVPAAAAPRPPRLPAHRAPPQAARTRRHLGRPPESPPVPPARSYPLRELRGRSTRGSGCSFTRWRFGADPAAGSTRGSSLCPPAPPPRPCPFQDGR